jgi:hypothetical protein
VKSALNKHNVDGKFDTLLNRPVLHVTLGMTGARVPAQPTLEGMRHFSSSTANIRRDAALPDALFSAHTELFALVNISKSKFRIRILLM